ncbi:Fez family zinc finger protein erm [Gryllus bimaculatus]|nr:Fez family zinc finger protein erm [Gryllus bimaculatus]
MSVRPVGCVQQRDLRGMLEGCEQVCKGAHIDGHVNVRENSESQESNNENPDSPDALAINSDESSEVITTENNPSEANIGEPAKVIQENVSPEKASFVSKTVKNKKLSLQSHIVVLPGTPQKYRCTICNKECSSKYTVQYHNYCGSKNKRFKCETCDKGFVTKSHYDYHMKSHKGILPYVCSICGKGFKQKGKLQRHSIQHSDDRPFVCQECGKTFRYYESLKSHQRVHKGEKPHVCQLCSRSFTEFSNYKKHVNIVHKGEKAHMCDTCGKTFALRRTLILHISMVHHHDRNYFCNTCNKPFNLKKDLKRHEVVHSVVQPHSCTLCGQGFRRKDNFERHMKNTHPETRMVIVGTFKQKPSANKAAADNNQKNKHKSNENGEVIEKNIPSPIPPSQTVDPETLRSITKISDEKRNLYKAREDKFSEHNRETNSSNYMETDMQSNYSTANPNTSLIQESLHAQFPEQCYKNVDTIQKTAGDSATTNIPQESNPVAASTIPTIYPPKKNVEYYREVSVINRSSNVMSSSVSESNGQNINTNYQQAIVRHVEGTNCVPTITRASECVSGSVITRNLQQPSSSVVKPISSHRSYQAVDLVPCLETQVDQPSLRKLLHDVKCSDGSDILNLTNDVNMNKRSLFTDDFRHVSDLKFYKHNDVEQFYSSKYPDTHVPETSLPNAENEHSSIIHEKYLSNNYTQKIPSETLISHNNCKHNFQSLNYSFIPPSCAVYRDNSDENLSQYSEILQPSEMENRNSNVLNKTYTENYVYSTKHFDSDSRLKLLSGISHTEDASCAQAVGQPVIVGTKKVSNNVICTNFSS